MAPGIPPARAVRAVDGVLDFLLIAFAAWTAIYHACLVLRIPASWAGLATVLAVVPAGVLAARPGRADPVPAAPPPRGASRLLPVNAAAGVAAAVLFAFTDVPWVVVWSLWLVAAGCAVVASADRSAEVRAAVGGWEVAIVAAWAVALALLALLLRGADADDAYYVHLASWVAAHGEFPLRDVAYSDQVFPALYFPPVFSFEALAGVVANAAHVSAPSVVYLAVPPVSGVLIVLAFWRLLRAWRVRARSAALTVAFVFLLFDAPEHLTYGSFFVARVWQGKVLFLVILVPLLLALLQEYAAGGGRRRLLLLFAAGVAAVGLTSSAIFVVPVIAAGGLAPAIVRSPRSAVAGLAAACAYPLGAGAVTLAVGGRAPAVYTASQTVPDVLAHYVLGTGVLALVALTAVLVGPTLLGRPGRLVAGAVLLVGLLLTPGVPPIILDLTGLGRVLWRLNWALPAAALVGVLATAVAAPRGRALTAAALCGAIVLAGTPVWSSPHGGPLRIGLRYKIGGTAAAHAILAQSGRGDVILAPRTIGHAIMVLSGDVTTVSLRRAFTRALTPVAEAHVPERKLLQRFSERGLGAVPPDRIRAALHMLGVDIACVQRHDRASRMVVRAAGYRSAVTTPALACFEPAL